MIFSILGGVWVVGITGYFIVNKIDKYNNVKYFNVTNKIRKYKKVQEKISNNYSIFK